jgi:hypothetical protein
MSIIYKLSQISRISGDGKLIFKQANLRGVFVQIIDKFQIPKNRVPDKRVFKGKNRKRVHIAQTSRSARAPHSPTYIVHGERLVKIHVGIIVTMG